MRKKVIVRLNEDGLKKVVGRAVCGILNEFEDWRAQFLHSSEKDDDEGIRKAERMAGDKYGTEVSLGKKRGDGTQDLSYVRGYEGNVPSVMFHGYDDMRGAKKVGRNLGQLDREFVDYLNNGYKDRLKRKMGLLGNRESGQDFTPNALKESFGYSEFDNVPDDFVDSLDGQYYEVTVPDWCLPYLVNGDEEGYTEEEIEMMDNFIDSFNGKLWYGLNVGDACVPMDGVSPSFCSRNDVGGGACDCYRFCLPMKEAERSGVDGELNETRLKRLIRESINEVLDGELDDDDVVDYMRTFDDEEEGKVFNVSQYKVTLGGNDYTSPEKILDETGLSKEEAWAVFKKAAEYAYKYDWKNVSFYGTKDYIEWPIVSSEVDGVLGKRRVSFPEGGAFEIANVIENAKKQNRVEGGYKELCDDFLKHARETFFSGKYEYHSW